MSYRSLLFTLYLGLMYSATPILAADAPAGKPQSPVSPDESLKWFQLDDGLRIEIAAAEPEVVDPVAVRFDEDGRMWVAEYRDYPNGPEAGGKPLSRIKLLEDRDGDGRYETAHVFAENLLFCNGLQPWNGGVIATMSGRIAFLKDTDGDNRADVDETWYVGFAEENPQLRVNHPRFALDNHVYVANGLRGGEAVNPRDPKAKPVSLRGHDLRFDPRTGAYEAVSGNGQFGLTFDDFGNRFLCSNRNPLFQVMFEDRYLQQNPNYVVPAVVNDVAASGEASKVFPLVEAWTTSILHAGQFTAACGIDIYRGDALPAEYYGNSFTCEPTGSLVHREVISPAGPTFKGRSPYEGREFLASRDPWCRPVYCDGGPDGALYVCDMYRAVIEHPQFVPPELKNRPDLRYGEDRGRIYRIVGKDIKRPPTPKLSTATAEQLVELLEHKNAWQRETAQRLLYERQDRGAREFLEMLVTEGKTPKAQIHALWTLEGMGMLTGDVLGRALSQKNARVRDQALILSEPRLDDERFAAAFTKTAMNVLDERNGFQLVLTATHILPGDERLLPVRGKLNAVTGLGYAGDVWQRRASILASGTVPEETLSQAGALALEAKHGTLADRCNYLRELAAAVAAQPEAANLARAFNESLKHINDEGGRDVVLATLNGLSKGLKDKLSDVVGTSWLELATSIVADPKEPASRRLDACDLFAYVPLDKAAATLQPLLQDADLDVRSRALAALAAHRDPQVGEMLLDEYPQQSPRFRGQILDAMLSRSERVKLLLDAIEAKRIKATDLDTTRTARLLKTADAKIKARVEKLLAASIPADRTKALEDYQRVLTLTADPRRGKEVFKKNCATCHKVGDVGTEVGPSIADLRTKTPEQVLTDVIMPNKAIDNNFVSYTVVTTDGLTYVGLLASDTPAGVTLKLPEGKTQTILRTEIDVMESNGKSLMPEGVEKQIPHQDMADVIAFVKNWRYLDGAVPGLGGTK